jgi:uncharacterized protein involved in exopolysaccharide biosynthesis
MISNAPILRAADEEIDLFAVFGVLWRYKFTIAIVVSVCVVAAVIYAMNATKFFRAEVVLTEVTDRNTSVASSLTSQLGGLASLAGVNLMQRGATRESHAVLQSRRLVEEFVSRNQLGGVLFQGDKPPPTLWYAVRKFREEVLDIREDTRRGTVTVSIEWTSPQLAARWANGFVALANDILRTRALEESQRNIDYLNEQLARTDVIEMQRVMFGLIESETKTLMIAKGRTEYAFTVVDPAVAPEIRAKPRRTVIALIGAVLGLLIGSIGALVHNALHERRRGPLQAAHAE